MLQAVNGGRGSLVEWERAEIEGVAKDCLEV